MVADAEIELIAEQLRHTVDLLKAENNMLKLRISALEDAEKDHESRIRNLTDGVTSFRVWSGLASGGSSIMSIVALVKAFFMG